MKYFKNEFIYLQDSLSLSQYDGTNIILAGETRYTKTIEIDQRKSYSFNVQQDADPNMDFDHYIEVSNDGVNFFKRHYVLKTQNKKCDSSWVLSPIYDFKYFRIVIINKVYTVQISPKLFYFESEFETGFTKPKTIQLTHNDPYYHYLDTLGYKLDGTLFIPSYSFTESEILDISHYKFWEIHLKQPFAFADIAFSIWTSKDKQNWINYSGYYMVNTNFLDVVISANYYENCNNYLKFIMEVSTGGAYPFVIFKGSER